MKVRMLNCCVKTACAITEISFVCETIRIIFHIHVGLDLAMIRTGWWKDVCW